MLRKLGKFELLERLGGGGMAEVFRARLHGPQGFAKDIALKLILPQFSDEPEFVEMFIHEATVAAQLDHASIVRIHEFDQIDGTYYIAMELVDGKDLRSISARARNQDRPIKVAEALAIALDVARGLAFAHAELTPGRDPIIHRDISPHNIIVSRAGEVKITDFGIAKMASTASLTRTGVIKGKASYMSPEQARGERVDPRCDIFSLGCVLWELLSGQRLFTGDNDLAVLEKLQHGRVESCRRYNPEVPEQVDALVLKALRKRADERFARAGDLARELDRLLAGMVPDRTTLLADMYRELFGGQRLKTALLPTVRDDPAAAEPENRAAGRDDEQQSTTPERFPPAQVPVQKLSPIPQTHPEQPVAAIPANTNPSGHDTVVDAVASASSDSPVEPAAQPRAQVKPVGPAAPTEIRTSPLMKAAKGPGPGLLLRPGMWLAVLVLLVAVGLVYYLSTGRKQGQSSGEPTVAEAGRAEAGPAVTSGQVAAWAGRILNPETGPAPVLPVDGGVAKPGTVAEAEPRQPKPKPATAGKTTVEKEAVKNQTATVASWVADKPGRRSRQDKLAKHTGKIGGKKSVTTAKKTAVPRGRLDLNVIPWAKVYWKGKFLGDTPLRGAVLAAGQQRLVLVNRDLGARRVIKVKIIPRRTTRRLVDLTK